MKLPTVLTVIALAAFALPMRAVPVAAFDFTNPQLGSTSPITLGFDFTVHSALLVTHLGIFDQNANGLGASHQVGLWTNTGSLLAQVTIPSGTAATLDDSFRYLALDTSVLLNPGVYVVGARMDGFEIYAQKATIENLTGLVSYGTSRLHNADTSFTYPEKVNPFGDNAAYFGPNLKVEAVSQNVPDSGGWSLMAISFLGLAAIRCRMEPHRVAA
jgi:hypothetical protein